MQKLLPGILLLALSAGAVAQTQAIQTNTGTAIISNGPVVAGFGNKFPETGNAAEMRIAKEVRHELLMLPYYSLFDDLEYSVQGNTVTLSGSVTSDHAQTKSDARARGAEN